MTINSFKKQILVWDEIEKNFYTIQNNFNINLKDLLFLEKKIEVLLENTILFSQGKPANNGLLWGARGTGKSSLVFSIFNYVKKKFNISLLEIKRNQVKNINVILRRLDKVNQKIIIFFDDFSFVTDSEDFIVFKNILDGSVYQNSNYLFYATSNFRNMIQYNQRSSMDMLQQQQALDNETALSDRFGIWLGFETFTNQQYLQIVNYYCLKFNIKINKSVMRNKALQWSINRGSKSGREAYYFVKSLHNKKI